MAQKQDPPKKLPKAPKGTMTPPSRKKMLERIDKVIKRSVKPKAASRIIKKALAKGDQSSAASTFTARAAKKVAIGAGKSMGSMAAKKIVSKMDSLPKQTYFSTKGGGNVSNKSGGDYYIERMGKKPIAKKDTTSLKKIMK
jgi:hypothetical protein